MNNVHKIKRRNSSIALFIILLLFNLPFISALEISNVRAEDVTDTSAIIAWETDQPADSFVSSSTTKESLTTKGDASLVTLHLIPLKDLQPETTYYYKVQSNDAIADNNGDLFSFTTLSPDTTAPELTVSFPEVIAGTTLTISGTTEVGATVTIKVNTALAASTVASSQENASSDPEHLGQFTFSDVSLQPNIPNNITIEATDNAGNVAAASGTVFADTTKPNVKVQTLPSITDQNDIELKVNISEVASYEITVNNRSAASGEAQMIRETINLDEGINHIIITVKDKAGWEATEELDISSDSQPPTVNFKLEKGNEYYQGRATTNIHGTTEAGANVYLYVYRPLGYEYNPKFDNAWQKVTASGQGEFTFKDVNFEQEPLKLTVDTLAPEKVPVELVDYSIFPVQQVAEQQQFTYIVFVIAEDATKKTGHQQASVTVNTCYSANNAFDIRSILPFQKPDRLNPQLLDEGREVATAVFNLSYRGEGNAKRDLATGAELERAFEVTDIDVEKACTQSMQKDDEFKLGCTIMPARPKKIDNADRTAMYLSFNLHTAEKLSEKKEDFWNEFKKRQVVFPMKIKIGYRERNPDGTLGEPKTQTSCYDLSYFIDIPIDSKDMLPDFLAEEGLEAIDFTIEKINTVLPYLETAIKVTGVGCISSFLGRMLTRWGRIFISKVEIIFSAGDNKCPSNSNTLLTEDDRQRFVELENKGLLKPENMPKGDDWRNPDKTLDTLCPMTSNMWDAEAVLDQAYRWTCDRVFCRDVPAGWTSKAEKAEVDTAILSQSRCSITAQGIPLQEIENCQEQVKQDVTNPSPLAASLMKKGSFTCYRNNDKLYVIDSDQPYSQTGVVRLKRVHDFGLKLNDAPKYVGDTDLIAYRPVGSEKFIVGKDQACKHVCANPQKTGYVADTELGDANGCYKEEIDSTTGRVKLFSPKNKEPIKGNRFAAGYTSDCFVNYDEKTNTIIKNDKETGLSQCVCTTTTKETPPVYGARAAIKETDGTVEAWDYRQAQTYRENKAQGTYYPEWRYYGGRDVSAAFGADFLLDYLNPEGKKEYHQVNPNTQHLGAFQTVCLSGIRARLLTVQAILQGLRGCIEEAKITGLKDAGVCKSLFAQHVCGLMYKSIAYLNSGCSPLTFDDIQKGTDLEKVGATFSAGLGSIGEAMQSSINDIKDDYGNAKLNEFFATGAQGFAQSMCMAAFGYDWPMGMDFILDSAYAFPMKTTAHVIPAQRELATFNPATGTAIYNYNIGALILPGCKIKSADVYLKCIGQEDSGHPGVECGAQGCDCLQATEASSVEGERIRYLDQGRQFNLKPGSFVDMNLPSPQKIDSHYRYDHAVLDLKLDPYESADTCFDEGYKDGKFYFPIIDTSAPGTMACQVQVTSGKLYCPEIQALFGGGANAYLEDPYISCYDKSTQSYALCKTPNLFTKNDQIKVKTHVVTDGGKYCLKVSATGLGPTPQQLGIKPLPEKIPGPFGVEVSLGTVTESLFSGAVTNIVSTTNSRQENCAEPQIVQFPEMTIPTQTISFTHQLMGADQYKVQIPAGIGITVDAPYTISATNHLTLNGKDILSSQETKQTVFNINGLRVKNLIGNPLGKTNSCPYQITPAAGSGYAQNQKSISVTAELLLPDVSGDCFNAYIPVKTTGFGKAKHTENILLQLEPITSEIVSKMHEEFMKGNCQYVLDAARSIISRKKSDIDDATAIYYSAACYVIQGKHSWVQQYKTPVCNLAKIFFDREYEVTGETGIPYPVEVISTAEYIKIHKYLTEIKIKAWCDGVTSETPAPETTFSGKTTCGYPVTRGDFAKFLPENWNQYVCRKPKAGELVSSNTLPGSNDPIPQCWTRGMYSTEEIAKQSSLEFGCKADLYCCPPLQ